MMKERRLSPRFGCRWPVEVHGRHGDRFYAQTVEVSPAGISMLVDPVTAIRLAPAGSILHPSLPTIALQVRTPGPEQVVAFPLEGRVRHIRRLSQQQYLIGVQLIDPDAAQPLLRAVAEHRLRRRSPVGSGAVPDF